MPQFGHAKPCGQRRASRYAAHASLVGKRAKNSTQVRGKALTTTGLFTVYLYSYAVRCARRMSKLGGILYLEVAFDQCVCACTRRRSRARAGSERKHEVTGLRSGTTNAALRCPVTTQEWCLLRIDKVLNRRRLTFLGSANYSHAGSRVAFRYK